MKQFRFKINDFFIKFLVLLTKYIDVLINDSKILYYTLKCIALNINRNNNINIKSLTMYIKIKTLFSFFSIISINNILL